jgi:hypothetical protein
MLPAKIAVAGSRIEGDEISRKRGDDADVSAVAAPAGLWHIVAPEVSL